MTDHEMYEGEERTAGNDMRESLILAGIAEIEENGPAAFSLRRVASACGVSCAAPYKHFESKEALIGAIFAYIDEKWALLEQHILTVFPKRDVACLAELCLAGVRFWIGNPHFHALRMQNRRAESAVFRDKTSVGGAAEEILWSLLDGCSEEEKAEKLFVIRSLAAGATLMLEDGTLPNTPETFRMLRKQFEDALRV